MKVTDGIRTYAEAHYGPRADDYLAAIERIVVPGEMAKAETNGPADGLALSLVVYDDTPGLVTVFAEGTKVGVPGITPSDARLGSIDLAAMADAVEFGWLT